MHTWAHSDARLNSEFWLRIKWKQIIGNHSLNEWQIVCFYKSLWDFPFGWLMKVKSESGHTFLEWVPNFCRLCKGRLKSRQFIISFANIRQISNNLFGKQIQNFKRIKVKIEITIYENYSSLSRVQVVSQKSMITWVWGSAEFEECLHCKI